MPTNAGLSSWSDGAFERFLTAALATIITIMFSWRLLTEQEEAEGLTAESSSSSDQIPIQLAAGDNSNTQSFSFVHDKTPADAVSDSDNQGNIDPRDEFSSSDKSISECVFYDSYIPVQESPLETKNVAWSDDKLHVSGLSHIDGAETLKTWDDYYKWKEERGEDDNDVIKIRSSANFCIRNSDMPADVHTHVDRELEILQAQHETSISQTFPPDTDADAISEAINVSNPGQLSPVSFSKRFANFEYKDAWSDGGHVDFFPDTESEEDTSSSDNDQVYDMQVSDSDSDAGEGSEAGFYGVTSLDTIMEELENDACDNCDGISNYDDSCCDKINTRSISTEDVLSASSDTGVLNNTNQECIPSYREYCVTNLAQQDIYDVTSLNNLVTLITDQTECSSVSETIDNVSRCKINEICHMQENDMLQLTGGSENTEGEQLPERVLPLNKTCTSSILGNYILLTGSTECDMIINATRGSSECINISPQASLEKDTKCIDPVTVTATVLPEISPDMYSSSLVRTCALDYVGDELFSDTDSCSNESVITVISVKSNDSDNHESETHCDHNMQINESEHVLKCYKDQSSNDQSSLIREQNIETLGKYKTYSLVSGFRNDSLNSLLSGNIDSNEQLTEADTNPSRENVDDGPRTWYETSIGMNENVSTNCESTGDEPCVSSSEYLPFTQEIIKLHDESNMQENVNGYQESSESRINENDEHLNEKECSFSDSSSDNSDPPLREYDPEYDDLAAFQFNLDSDDDSFYLVMCSDDDGNLRNFDTFTNLNSVGLSPEYGDAVTSHTAPDDGQSFKYSQTEYISTIFRKRLYMIDRASPTDSETGLPTVLSVEDVDEGRENESERSHIEPIAVQQSTLPITYNPHTYSDAHMSTLHYESIDHKSTKSDIDFQKYVIKGGTFKNAIHTLYPSEKHVKVELKCSGVIDDLVTADRNTNQIYKIDTGDEVAANAEERCVNCMEQTKSTFDTVILSENFTSSKSADIVLTEPDMSLGIIEENVSQKVPSNHVENNAGNSLMNDRFDINDAENEVNVSVDTQCAVNGLSFNDYENEKRSQNSTSFDNTNSAESNIDIPYNVNKDVFKNSRAKCMPKTEYNEDSILCDNSVLKKPESFSDNDWPSNRNYFEIQSLNSVPSQSSEIEMNIDDFCDDTQILLSKKLPIQSSLLKCDVTLSSKTNIDDILTADHGDANQNQTVPFIREEEKKTNNDTQCELGSLEEKQEFTEDSQNRQKDGDDSNQNRQTNDETLPNSYKDSVSGFYQNSLSFHSSPNSHVETTCTSKNGMENDAHKTKQLPLTNSYNESIDHLKNMHIYNQSSIIKRMPQQTDILNDHNKFSKIKPFDKDLLCRHSEHNRPKTYPIVDDYRQIPVLSHIDFQNNNGLKDNTHFSIKTVENKQYKNTENSGNYLESDATLRSINNTEALTCQYATSALHSQQMSFKDYNENVSSFNAENVHNVTNNRDFGHSPEPKNAYNCMQDDILSDCGYSSTLKINTSQYNNEFKEQSVNPCARSEQNSFHNECDTNNETSLKFVIGNVYENTKSGPIASESLSSVGPCMPTLDDDSLISLKEIYNSLQARYNSIRGEELNGSSRGTLKQTPVAKPHESFIKSSDLRGVKKKVQQHQLKKYTSILQQPVTPEKVFISAETAEKPPSAARMHVLKSRKQFFSAENLARNVSKENFEEQFQHHKASLELSTPRRYLKRHERYLTDLQSTESLPSNTLSLNMSHGSTNNIDQCHSVKTMPSPSHIQDLYESRYNNANSSFQRGQYDKLHANCIFTPEKREQIRHTTKSLENMFEQLLQYGSVFSVAETELDNVQMRSFQDTDINHLVSFQFPLERAASMSALTGSSDCNKLPRKPGKKRFASRNVPKSKSLQTLETNLDDVFANENEQLGELKKNPSVHELRVSKSLSKLNVPDWFKKSSFSRSDSTQSLFTYAGKLGSTSTLGSSVYPASITTSPCPSVTPISNAVVIQKRVTPSPTTSSTRLFRAPMLPTTPEKAPIHQTKQGFELPSDKFRKQKEEKELKPISIVPFAKLREMFEKKSKVDLKSNAYAISPTQEKPIGVRFEQATETPLEGYHKSHYTQDSSLGENKPVQNERTISPPPIYVPERKPISADNVKKSENEPQQKRNQVHFSDETQVSNRSQEQNSLPVRQNGTGPIINSSNVKKPQSLRTSLPLPQFRFRRPGSYASKAAATAQNASTQYKKETTV